MYIGSGWANNCGKELFTLGWVGCGVVTILPESGGGKSSRSGSQTAFSKQQLLQVQRDDEELVAIVSIIGKILL